jgi:hypothetical protein
MADLNTTYHPYIQSFDYEAIKAELWYDLFPDDSEIKQNMTKFLAELKQSDVQQTTTANAVSLPYSGTTAEQRTLWLKDRISAVYTRLDLIRSFVEGYKAQLLAAGAEVPTDPMKTIGLVLTAIPLTAPVGAAATLISKLLSNDNGNAQYKAKKVQEASSAIAGFAQDAGQLQAIYSQLTTEYTKAANPSTDPTQEAPNIRTDYILYGLAAVVLVGLYIWYRKRKKRKRSRR